jgi:predicted nuclease of predicted toxin-antitoxin system
MKFLADENISNKVVNSLRDKGIDIISIRLIASGLSDESVLDTANKQKRVVVSFDEDFGELIYRSKRKAHGIILLKFIPKSQQHVIDVLSNVLTLKTPIEGHFLIVNESRIRVLRLK